MPKKKSRTIRSVVCVHERFDADWPFAADYWYERWQQEGGCELYRSEDPAARAPLLVPDPSLVQRLVLLGFPAAIEDIDPFTAIEECFHIPHRDQPTADVEQAAARGVSIIAPRADVFDIEPVPLGSPLLGRDNVVHTPHNAGRTIDANHAWADDQIARFRPR